MSDQIPGNGALYPEDFTIPDDTDVVTAGNVNPAFEALANRTEFLRTHGGAAHELTSFAVTTDYTWTVPAGVYWFWVFLIGGGGGGGAGVAGAADTDNFATGGGGGGGSEGRWHLRSCAPGMLIYLTIGAGGLGSTVAGTKGDDGGYTLCTDDGPGLIFGVYGGSGGQGGDLATPTFSVFAPGGGKCIAKRRTYTVLRTCRVYPQLNACDGGYSTSGDVGAVDGINRSAPGQLCDGQEELGYANGGTCAATVSSYGGGYGGGGGGSSTYGAGGTGGNGGTANAAGTGGNATAGANAANVGAGGGGGGGGGSGSSGGGAKGNGGNGAAGLALIAYPNPEIEVP